MNKQKVQSNIPQHIVLFPDGNRRWAKRKGLPTLQGHLKGKEKFEEFLNWCKNRGVHVVTVFGFSMENWNRSKSEVMYLMKLFEKYLGDKKAIQGFQQEGVRIKIIGQKDLLPRSLQKVIEHIEKRTENNTHLYLNLAVSYGGKWDIVQAVNRIIKDKKEVTEKTIDQYLSTAGLSNPDLIIRVGGEKRLSNFVLWQAAYAELYFCDKYWPDFTEQDLDDALAEYARRQRRFGS